MEEVINYFMSGTTAPNLHVVDSNTTLRDDRPNKTKSLGIIDMTKFRTSHLSFSSHTQPLDLDSEKFADTKSLLIRITEYLALSYYRYEVTFGIYVLRGTEKIIFNSILMAIMSVFIYALYLSIPFSWLSGLVNGIENVLILGSSSVLSLTDKAEAGNFSQTLYNFTAWSGTQRFEAEI